MDRALLSEEVIARLDRVIVSPDMPVSAALEPLDRAGLGVLLLADDDRKLAGVVTDGDIRRAILGRRPLSLPCQAVATLDPIVARATVSPAEALRLMDSHTGVSHLPIVDENRRLLGLLLRGDLVDEESLTLQAVVMAGGFGTRLMPLTEETPKPMLPVGDRPVMAHLVEGLRQSGIRRINVTTHFQPDKIKDYFGDGRNYGMDIQYVSEDRPLGTAGAIGLMKDPQEPLLVVNGDILTRVDFRSMLTFHRRYKADLTIGVRQYEVHVPYGVIECEGVRVKAVREKPSATHLVNAGIYLLEPSVHRHIPTNQRFDMTDLIERLIAQDRPVVSFPIVEYWLDIGRHADYERAQIDAQTGRIGR